MQASAVLIFGAQHIFFFFFQAEDGIRDLIVTGVQTCALPIWTRPSFITGPSSLHQKLWSELGPVMKEGLVPGDVMEKSRILGLLLAQSTADASDRKSVV